MIDKPDKAFVLHMRQILNRKFRLSSGLFFLKKFSTLIMRGVFNSRTTEWAKCFIRTVELANISLGKYRRQSKNVARGEDAR
jgi:hypothetical protein